MDLTPAAAAGEYKDAAEGATTKGGDTSPVAEEAMVVHDGDNHDIEARMHTSSWATEHVGER